MRSPKLTLGRKRSSPRILSMADTWMKCRRPAFLKSSGGSDPRALGRESMFKVIHIVNQFFAGLGAEEKANSPVGVVEEASGAARGLQAQLGDQAKVVATIYCGDNYFHEHIEEARSEERRVGKECRSRWS